MVRSPREESGCCFFFFLLQTRDWQRPPPALLSKTKISLPRSWERQTGGIFTCKLRIASPPLTVCTVSDPSVLARLTAEEEEEEEDDEEEVVLRPRSVVIKRGCSLSCCDLSRVQLMGGCHKIPPLCRKMRAVLTRSLPVVFFFLLLFLQMLLTRMTPAFFFYLSDTLRRLTAAGIKGGAVSPSRQVTVARQCFFSLFLCPALSLLLVIAFFPGSWEIGRLLHLQRDVEGPAFVLCVCCVTWKKKVDDNRAEVKYFREGRRWNWPSIKNRD